MLKEKFPDAGMEEEQVDENFDEKKTSTHVFLKRGSRQHLSSAITRGKTSKEDELNKSALDKSRDLTPKNTKSDNRSISQNRVLGKRNPRDSNDKSMNKGAAKKLDDSHL